MSDTPPDLRRIALVIGAMFAFSLMAVFTRGAQEGFLAISAWRAIFVALVFGIWVVVAEGGVQALRVEGETLRLGSILGVALALASSTFVGGYAFTTVANTIFLHNLAPVVVFPLAWWVARERPHPAALTGSLIALSGVALLSGVSLFQVSHFANTRFLLGDFLAVLSALGYGAVIVITRATRLAKTPIVATLFIAWAVAAVLLTGIALASGQLAISGRAIPWIIGLAVISTNIPFYLLNLGMRSVSAGLASVLSLSEVIFATLLGLLAFGEHLSTLGWIGGVLASLGVLYAVNASNQETSENQPPPPLSPKTQLIRSVRVAQALILVNIGAFDTLLGGHPAGSLLAWAALIWLIRLGLPLALSTLSVNLHRPLCWMTTLLASVTLLGLIWRGGWAAPEITFWVIVPAAIALVLDRLLAHQEAEAERDPNTIGQAALLMLTAGLLLAGFGHPASSWLTALCAALVGLVALSLLIGGLRSQLSLAPQHHAPALARLRGLAARLGAPRPALVLLASAFALGGIQAIPAGHVGIIERFGYPLPAVAEAGLQLRWPPPIERIIEVDLTRVQRLPIIDPGTPLLCGDHALVAVEGTIHFTVDKPQDYIYTSATPERTLANLARSALVRSFSHRSQDAVLTVGRQELEAEVVTQPQGLIDASRLGVKVVGVHLATIAVPSPVLASFLDVINADEERQTHINQANAYAADLIPRTRGQAFGQLSQAQGDARHIEARAQGAISWLEEVGAARTRAPELTLFRISLERLEQRLDTVDRLVVAPPDVELWLESGTRPPFLSLDSRSADPGEPQ